MAITIGELRGILTLQDQFSKPINSAASQLGKFNKSFAAVGKLAAAATGAIVATTGAIVALGIHGSKVEGIKSSFEALSRAAGQSADVMLGSMRAATSGLVSDFDLMAAANKAMLLGLPVTAESMGTMAKAATVLGRAMKQDATKSLDDLTTALGRGSPLILDNLGLTVKVGEANEAYAKTLGKSASQLTEGEKKLAFYNAAMGAAKAKLGELGELQLSFGLRVQQARTMVTNFVDSLSLAVATSPVVAAGMDSIMASIQGAFGGDQQETVKKLIGYVNDFAIFLVEAASVGVSAAQFITNAFQGTKVLFNAFLELLFTGIAKAASALSTLAAEAAALPVVGKGFQAMAAGFRLASDTADSLAFGFGEMKDKALDSAAASNAGFDKMKRGLDDVETAMVAAADAQVKVNEAVKDFAEATGEAAPRAKESTEKIAAAYQKLQEEISLIGTVGIDRRMKELEIARQNEIAGLRNLKDLTAAEYEEMAATINEKYRQMSEAARFSSDEILEATRRLQEELALATTTGLEQQLLAIEFKRQKEIEGLEYLRERYVEDYERIAALVNEKYDEMTAAATGHGLTVEQLAAQAGFKTRAEMEATAAKALKTYQGMLASGKYAFSQLREAHEAWKKAEADLDEKSAVTKLQGFEMIAESASGILRSLFGQSKAAAIAAAIIDTIAAVVKTLAAYPWPWSLAPAAAAAAAGAAQISKIRSTNAGFAAGTPGTRFQDFGRESAQMLHGREAIVTPTQAEGVADVVVGKFTDAVAGMQRAVDLHGGGGEQRIVLEVDGQVLSEVVVRRNRAGLLPIRQASVRRA